MRCNFLVWSVLLMLYAIIANLIIHCIIRHFKETRKDNEAKGMGERIFFLGFFELFSYIISIVLGYPQFIAVWLGIRTLGRWRAHKTTTATINFFLIGTLLSVLAGVLGGIIFIKYAEILSLPINNYLSKLITK